MMINKIITIIFLATLTVSVSLAQTYRQQTTKGLTEKDMIMAQGVRNLPIPLIYQSQHAPALPSMVNNSTLPYFRPIFLQEGWSCNQAGGIGYTFTYEINRLRDLPADTSHHQYPTHFSYNLLNIGQYDFGVSYFDTWEILKKLGTPTVENYGGMAPGGFTYWPSGYELYYGAMENRVLDYYRITVKNESGLNNLKHWIHDHMDGSAYGGLANYMIGSGGIILETLPPGTPEEGKLLIVAYSPYVGHNMTIVGYNDSIRYDINGDNKYTNNLDINNDGQVDLRDWEIGAFIVANSYGPDWANDGFAYMMYRLAALPPEEGGIFNNDFFVIKAKENVDPQLTMKIGINHTSRGKLQIVPGISTDTSDVFPGFQLDMPCFNFNGGDYFMQGDTTESAKFIELGLDISPLLSFVESGQRIKFFLSVQENDPDNSDQGEIVYCSIIDYNQGGTEVYVEESHVEIINNATTLLSVVYRPEFSQPVIIDENLPPFTPGGIYSHQLTGAQGTSPYQWSMNIDYLQSSDQEEFPDDMGSYLALTNNHNGFASQPLGFTFPYCGRSYDTVYLFADGYLKFDLDNFQWPYIVDPYMLFKLERSLAPFYMDLSMVYGNDEGVFYEGNEGYALFRWKARIYNHYPSEVNFALKLYPSGKIEFLYGDISNAYNLDFVSGISNGDGINYVKSLIAPLLEIPNGYKVQFYPMNTPQGLTVSEEGLLSGVIEDGCIDCSISISLQDNNLLTDHRVYHLVNNHVSVEHQLLSGGDNIIEYGEDVFLSTTIHNQSQQSLANMVLTLESESEYISFTDSMEYIGDIGPGQTLSINNAGSFLIGYDVEDQEPLLIDAVYASSTDTMEYRIIESINAPDIRIHLVEVDDGQNGVLDPGEETDVLISLGNFGTADATDLTAKLVCNDPAISVINDLADYGDITTHNKKTALFRLKVHELAAIGNKPVFELHITENQGLHEVLKSFTLQIGKMPVLVCDLNPLRHSGPLFDSILGQMALEYEVIYQFPDKPVNYHAIFLCLGGYFNNYELSAWQAEKLVDYLNNNGNLYMEGRPTWNQDVQTGLHTMFSHTVRDTSWFAFDTLTGVAGSFAEGLSFQFTGQNAYCNFYFQTVDSAHAILSANDDHSFCAIANNMGTYTTISSSAEFGLLEYHDQIIHTDSLLKTYLNFFGIKESTLAVDEVVPVAGAQLKVYPNPSGNQFQISFELGQDEDVELSIYNMQGKLIEKLAQGLLPASQHQITWYCDKPGRPDIHPGIYFCIFKTCKELICKKLIYVK